MIVEGPNGIRIEFPDGTDQETVNRVMMEAYNKSSQKPASPPAPGPAGYWDSSREAMDFMSGGLTTKGTAAVAGLLDAGLGAVQGKDWDYSGNYNRNLEDLRQAQTAYNDANPVRSGVAKGAGLALGITQLPVIGAGWKGAAGTGAAYGAVMGAGQDANSIQERIINSLIGTATGAGIGGAGYGLGKVAGMGLNKASRAWEAVNAPPETRAAIQLRSLADDAGGAAAVQKSLDALGPDAMMVDVLGERGRALGRNVSNISPDARETVEAALLGRKGMQNQRLVSDMERIAGLPQGSTKTVDDLVNASNAGFKPGIDQAYTAARAAGKDMPLLFFDDVLSTPQGQAAFKEAEAAVVARARLNGTPDDVSNLAIIDEMKKVFDSKATAAFRSGDNAASALATDFARNLRTRADAIMDGMENPIYAEARGLARTAKQAEDAIRLGDKLGSPRTPVNLPGKVADVDLGNRQRVAQGYVAKKADTLLNRGNTEGAINEFFTPQGRKAADAALGPDALKRTLDREKTFNQTVKALTGNSTTARQLVEMGLGTGVATALLTGDPMSGGIAGVLGALARKGAPAIARKITTDAQQKTAPLIAQMLIDRGLPPQVQQMAPGALERLVGAGDDKLVKALLMIAAEQQKPVPQAAAGR